MRELYPGRPFDRTFEEHVVDDPMCLESSDYRLQIGRYLEFYPRSSFLFLFTHELEGDETNTLRRVCDFLGIDWDAAWASSPIERRNVAKRRREGMVRVRLTGRIKSTPIVGRMPYLLPRTVREAGYRALRRMGAGSDIEKSFTPPPLRPETRRALIERFRPSNEWVADLTGADLSVWNR
jgi:hypothetical protein